MSFNKIPLFTQEGVTYIDLDTYITKINSTSETEKLYHFTTLDSFMKIWLSKKLLFSDRNRMNDVAEKFDMISGNNITKMQAYLYAVREYKQISLANKILDSGIEIYKSPLMWGLYANKGTGICIEFDKHKLIEHCSGMSYRDIEYCKCIPNNSLIDDFNLHINSIDDARQIVDNNLNDIFFKKYEGWKFENEFRIISRKHSYLDVSNSISRVYIFDVDFSTTEIIYNLINSECEIKLVFLSTIFDCERILDTFTLKKDYLKNPHSPNPEFEKWLKNDAAQNK